MLSQFGFTRPQHGGRLALPLKADLEFRRRCWRQIHDQAFLPTRDGDVNVGQQFSIKEGAVQRTVGIVDAVALAEGIQVVLLARVKFARHLQRIANIGADRGNGCQAKHVQFVVKEADIESGIVDDQFGAAYEVEKLVGNLAELRFVGEELTADAVDRQRALVDIAFRVDVVMQVAPGQPAIDHLHAGQFDDAVTESCFEAGGFSVEKYLSHGLSFCTEAAAVP